MPALRYLDPAGRVLVVELKEREIVIGRDPSSDLVVPKRYVSRKHASIAPDGKGGFVLTNLSTLGTLLNRRRVEAPVALGDGDEISVGDETVTYLEDAAREPRRPTPSGVSDGTARILAEQSLDEGQLLKTMRVARDVDVASLTMHAPSSVHQLVHPESAASTSTTPNDDSIRLEAEVAGHLLTLVRIGDGLRRAPDVTSLCRTGMEMALAATRASRGAVALREGDSFRVLVDRRSDGRNDPLRVSRTFLDRMVKGGVALLAEDTGADLLLAGAESVVAESVRSMICAPLWLEERIGGYLYLDKTGDARRFRREDLDLVAAIGYQAGAEIALRTAEQRRNNLARFMAADVVRLIEERSDQGVVDPVEVQEQDVTVLFSDIRGFTALAERLEPRAVKVLLDAFFERMTAILVDDHGATLDKYIGDAIMALFGAPFSRGKEADAREAVAAATRMRDALAEMRAENPLFADLEMRIGINSGSAIAGMLGSSRRREYSVLGDVVNVASRLESSGEPGRIQIGETTWERVRDVFVCTPAGERQVKNRARPVRCYWVEGRKEPA